MPLPVHIDLIGDDAICQGKLWRVHVRLEVPTEPAAPFVNAGKWAVGDYAAKATDDGSRFLVTVAGTAAASEPVWPTALGGLVVSGGVTFMRVGSSRLLDTTGYGGEMDIRSTPDSGTTILTLTTGNGRIEVGYDPPKWLASTAYAVGAQVVPTTPNGWIYQAAAAGTGGSTEPVWPVVWGGNVADGTVTWRAELADAVAMTNLRLSLLDTDTPAVPTFTTASYDIELKDLFNRVYGVAVGYVSMWRERSRP